VDHHPGVAPAEPDALLPERPGQDVADPAADHRRLLGGDVEPLPALQRVDPLAPLAGGQAGQPLRRPRVGDPVAAQRMGGGGVLPQHGHDQVVGPHRGGAGLGGDALGLVDHEPQPPR
jgi:hypothetical protein